MNVSYLENLRFDGRKAGPTQARRFVSPRLHQALVDLDEYLAKLHERTAAPDPRRAGGASTGAFHSHKVSESAGPY